MREGDNYTEERRRRGTREGLREGTHAKGGSIKMGIVEEE